MANLVHNERLKLIATFLNNLGIAAIASGVFVTVFSLSPVLRDHGVAVILVVSYSSGFSLHSLAVSILAWLRE